MVDWEIDSNYRGACCARSKKEFISKLGVAIEEADESFNWLAHLIAAKLVGPEPAESLRTEAGELKAIFIASKRTAENNPDTRDNRRRTPRTSWQLKHGRSNPPINNQ